ncbi:M15 family metallopeptidase [Marivirga arenosa]|uniref:D-alanyl-D-alanine dipeptidase n=2 Tax=Marivirga arenosa TaxID=3059076 RepID=A0AA49GC24_9BACT|nr:M15 family metallopeptidase [Marivirga sp. BKB1-2]
MNKIITILFSSALFLLSCHQEKKNEKTTDNQHISVQQEESAATYKVQTLIAMEELADSAFVNLREVSDSFQYDMRYATANNFLGKKVYDCDNCWLRARTVRALIKANRDFIKNGYQIQFYDCFRPRAVQYKMWEVMPDGRYVANPKSGSIHNRGDAVDITLVNISTKEELKMGTDFDYFGKEAHYEYDQLADQVQENRRLLRTIMEKHGFKGIRTEWWHFSYIGEVYPISNQALCNE